MPIFEYVCRQCHEEFEVLVQSSTEVTCPACAGDDLERKLSAFAVVGQGPAPRCEGGGPCAACCDGAGPSRCPIN